MDSGGKRALVVDDSRVMRLLLARTLAQAGFTDVAHAADGRAGPVFVRDLRRRGA